MENTVFDYKEMLRKYESHVYVCKGIDFLSDRYRYSLGKHFTPEEIVELRRVCAVDPDDGDGFRYD